MFIRLFCLINHSVCLQEEAARRQDHPHPHHHADPPNNNQHFNQYIYAHQYGPPDNGPSASRGAFGGTRAGARGAAMVQTAQQQASRANPSMIRHPPQLPKSPLAKILMNGVYKKSELRDANAGGSKEKCRQCDGMFLPSDGTLHDDVSLFFVFCFSLNCSILPRVFLRCAFCLLNN